MGPHIVVLCSLDTKGDQAQFLRERIEELGASTTVVDIGYGRPAEIDADLPADDVARAAGSNIEAIREMDDTGAASALMMQGAILGVQELFKDGRCDGVISFGGASNTTVATGVMKTLPVGMPKFMISSAAAMPAYASMYFGSTDITMMNAVVDFAGLNALTRAALAVGAGAIVGMAAQGGPIDARLDEKPVAVTGFRFSEQCSQAVISGLQRLGYSVIPFHAQGVGEDAMEDLLSRGLFRGVVDVVPAGLSEQLLGGNRSARADRLEGAGRAGIPQVIATSGFDMISCGPIGRKDDGDALWEERKLAQRRYSVPDRFRVEARTTPEEVAEIAEVVADKLNRADHQACVMVPVLGWSSLSVEGAELHDPDADAMFAPVLRRAVRPGVPVVEVDAELNSDHFAAALVECLHDMLQGEPVATS